MGELSRQSQRGTLVERDPKRADLVVAYHRSRREYDELVRQAASLDTRMLEAKAQMEFDHERLKEHVCGS
jgi:hypothetical protein